MLYCSCKQLTKTFFRRKHMNKLLAVSTLALMIGFAGAAHAQYQGAMARGGFTGPGLAVSTVAEANKMSDDQPVVLVGQIQQSLGDEKYLFKDASGTITIEIDDEDWRGVNVTPEDTIEISGEVDKDLFDIKVDVDTVKLKK